MLGLSILVAICIAGIAFMVVFLTALWQDARPQRSDATGKPYPKLTRGKVVEMPTPSELSRLSAGGKRKWGR